MKKLLLLLLLLPRVVEAQTIRADRFTFNTGPCVLRSGSGSPEGVVVGNVCDTYWRTDTGQVYNKTSGSGNTGWTTSGLTGSGTANTVTKWTGTTSLGNSNIGDDGTNIFLSPPGVISSRSLIPQLTDTYDLGRYDLLWNQGWLAQLNALLFALNTQTLFGGYSTIGFNAGSFFAPVGSADTTINFGTTMTPGHFVLTRAHDTGGTITAEFFQVGSLVSGTTYNVTRNLSGLGAKNWAQGVPFLVLGTTGIGRIDLFAYDGKPRIQVVEQGATYNTQTVRGVVGNLNGYYDYASDIHGAAFGAVSGARVTVDPTNGIRIYGGDNDQKITIDTSGNATFDGKLTVGTGRNILRNSECRVGTENWATAQTHGVTLTLGTSFSSSWRLNNEPSTCYINAASGTPANGQGSFALLSGQKFPAAEGIRYEASVYIGLHRATNAQIYFNWYNSAGGDNGQSANGSTCTTAHPGGQLITGYCRSVVFATAPAGTYSAEVVISMTHSGETDPFMFWTRVYFGEASTTQEDPTEWGPAGITEITNGLIKTDAIDARAIAADSITTSELAADSVTSAKIVAGTIVASDIATNTITANEIAAMQLSAISADLGTVTAGSISGVTGTFGSGGEVTLNNNGISITSGTNASNYYKFNNTTAGLRYSTGGTADVRGANGVVLISDAGSDVGWDGSAWFPLANDNDDLGKTSQRWKDLYLSGDAHIADDLFYNPNTTTNDLGPLVWDNNNNQILRKTDGQTGTGCGSVDVESGIVVACNAAPAPAPEVASLKQQVLDLQAQIDELREQLNAFLERRQ